VDLRTVLK